METETRRRALTPFQVNENMMSQALPEAIFLHCLPAHRGEEVTPAIIDGSRSVVFCQAANRRPVAQAVLHALLDGRIRGKEPK